MPSRVAIALLLGLLGATPAAGDGEQLPFAAVVESNFRSWAGNSDGRLTAERVEHLLRDRSVQGAQAAALAVIHLYQRSHRNDQGALDHPALSLNFLKEHSFEHAFNRALRRIAVRRVLFVHDLPSLDGLHQGPLGDCFFMAPLAAAVHRDPRAVKDMLHPRPDGACEVVFADGEKFNVPALTDGLVAISSLSSDNGIWASVLEEAYGMHRIKVGKQRGDPLALDAIAKGGGARYPIQLFTGYKAEQISLHHADPMTAERAAALERKLRPILARSGHRLTTAYCVGQNHPPDIATNHVYSILGFDPQGDIVTVRNPWGQHFEPKNQPPGLKNGYPTDNGVFHVPLREFVRIFSGVTFETGERLR